MRILIFILINVSILSLTAQYTYFNTVYGEFGDQETEAITNVEVIGDSIYLFGGMDNDTSLFSVLLMILDMDGEIIDERIMPKTYSGFFIGRGFAVSSLTDDRFLFTQAVEFDGVSHGVAIMYNSYLDTLWEKVYDLYPLTSTYFRANYSRQDTHLVLGSHNYLRSSFLAKLDDIGSVLWKKTLRNGSPTTEAYTNHTLVFTNNGYLVGGRKRDFKDIALLTKTDLEGNVEWEYYADNFEDIEGEQADTRSYRLAQLPNGEIVGAHMVYYEYYGPTTIPNNNPLWYRSLHLSKINVEDTSLYWEHDYFTDHEIKATVIWKIIPTVDNGILAMGVEQDETNYTWLLKVDSMGNQEWFNYYSYSENIEDRNNMFDIEPTSDGGYVMVGDYHNYTIDNFAKSWVMKIDACGDIEWQGCDYVGIQERIKNKFKIYPNPATDYVMIEGDFSPKANITVYDMLGNVVVNQPLSYTGKVDLTGLSKGMYSLLMVDKGERSFVGKVVVE